jgi:uncharacterized Ntn-hydrolase superfamily protein
MRILVCLLFICTHISLLAQDTFSIVAMDPETGEVGSAGASCVDLFNFFGLTDDFLGQLVPGKAAINTQAYYYAANQENALDQIMSGSTPQETLDWLLFNDVTLSPQFRQYGIVASVEDSIQAAAFTGSSTDDYKGHIVGPNYAIQGNILLGPTVLSSMEEAFLEEEGDLACKLMAAMQGANIIGADGRCLQNGTSSLFAFLKVAQPDDTFGNPSFLVSVRTPDGAGIEPIDSLQTLFDLEKVCLPSSVDKGIENPIRLYPNPFSDRIQLEGDKDSYTGDVEFWDLATGSNHYSKSIIDNTIDTRDLKNGLYLLRFKYNGEVIYKRMLKTN